MSTAAATGDGVPSMMDSSYSPDGTTIRNGTDSAASDLFDGIVDASAQASTGVDGVEESRRIGGNGQNTDVLRAPLPGNGGALDETFGNESDGIHETIRSGNADPALESTVASDGALPADDSSSSGQTWLPASKTTQGPNSDRRVGDEAGQGSDEEVVDGGDKANISPEQHSNSAPLYSLKGIVVSFFCCCSRLRGVGVNSWLSLWHGVFF